ncbi:MAG TPA: MBL fold metallo-hydrolase [Rhodanobacteraceae bacterium]|nr:MBL fold metallo-hydrolase [Rhodanobacteraceae bacterium]
MSWALQFLGTGNAQATELGASSVVLERAGKPCLLIDCGPDVLDRYHAAYGQPPRALYVTHTHLDHVGGFERLFALRQFGKAPGSTTVFLHAALVPLLQARVADYPGAAAEGGVNFWDALKLVPCTRGFWLDGLWFDVFATRHHVPGTSFGVALRGAFVYTGDTRPIPEALAQQAGQGERVVHDCALVGNPSHSGADDIEREYPEELRQRLVACHYASATDAQALEARGLQVARPGQRLPLPDPLPVRADAG